MSIDKFTFVHELGVERSDIERLYVDYSPRLINYAVRIVCDRTVAEDIVQECFAMLCEKKELLSKENLPALVYAKVRNSCIDVLRHRKVEQNYNTTYLSKQKRQEQLYNYNFNFDSYIPFVNDELEVQIKNIINTLPERSREVFMMSRFEGMKNKDIAIKLNISQTAVEKHISKTIRELGRQLHERYDFNICVVVLAWLTYNVY